MRACNRCHETIVDEHFNERVARRDQGRYRKDGPGSSAQLLRDLLVDADPLDGVLLR